MTGTELIDPTECLPPHRITHPEKLDELRESMSEHGWLGGPLAGYRLRNGAIQLISGSHRVIAARLAGLKRIPAKVHPEWHVRSVWGTDEWSSLF